MSYTAKDSFWFKGRIVHRGDVLSEHDPIVKGLEEMFDHKEEPKSPAARPHRGKAKHDEDDGGDDE